MKLTFVKPYLSIESFPECELPKFTVLTGVNGSGKTHLLQAINSGHVKSSVAARAPGPQVRLFDWTAISPNSADKFDGRAAMDDKVSASTQFVSKRNNLIGSFRKQLADIPLPQPRFADPQELLYRQKLLLCLLATRLQRRKRAPKSTPC
jgi:AAA15 family ATPase/GTPase